MDREQLEAAIWRQWPTRGPGATKSVRAIMAAIGDYLDAEIPAILERRAQVADVVGGGSYGGGSRKTAS